MLAAISSNPIGYTSLMRLLIVDLRWPIIGVLLYFGIRYSQRSGLFASVADVVRAFANQEHGAARMELKLSSGGITITREPVADVVRPNEITEIRRQPHTPPRSSDPS